MSGWEDRLRDRGALLEGHFRLSSGLHSPRYVQCARFLQHPEDAAEAGAELARRIAGGISAPPDVIVSPAIGGIVLGHEVARAFGCRAIWAERDDRARLRFRRGFVLDRGERVVAVEDVVTTGGSLRELVSATRSAGAEVVAAGALVDRSGGSVSWDVPWGALVTLHAEVVEPEACPLCARGIPATKPGSRPDSACSGNNRAGGK